MGVLSDLNPRRVFEIFEEICAVPHGSGHTDEISAWCMKFAEERDLACFRDGANNVVIVQEASAGYEDAPTVILQGHLDMVCEKAPDCGKDLLREGLELFVENGFVRAKGTTLGGDDGIAVAMALAVLDDPTICHPRLEVLLTTDEEIGMLGATAFDGAKLQGRQMVNIDSEAEGVFTVGCAGGCLAACTLPVERARFAGTVLRVAADGLVGGHSGSEIDKERANAALLMGRLLEAVRIGTSVRLISVCGGSKDNAIPNQAEAWIAAEDADAAKRAVSEMGEILRREFRPTDPEMQITCETGESALLPMDEASTLRCIRFLLLSPNGVQAMSRQISGLVETSLNLGILTTAESEMKATYCVRSSVGTRKEMLKQKLRHLTETLGGTVAFSGEYPAWEYREESPLRERMAAVFAEQYGHAPRIEAIHAGLECGILCGKLPGLDCISIGPDLPDIHTFRERMDVGSVERVWRFLLEVLRRSK